jgi:hydrogenase expression/formation protein HypE
MKIGKLPEPVLVRSVIKQVKHRRSEILTGPSVGVDCAALELAPGEVLVMSSDPITGTVQDIGSHCIHITANDLAASGAEPLGVMLTVLLPENVEEPEIRRMVREAESVCSQLNMEIFGGHTEVTEVVRQPLISVTGVGKVRKEDLLAPDRIRPGQDIVVSKWIGLEATSILAKEREEKLRERFSPEFIRTAREFDRYLSVVPDARAAMKAGVTAMHDITEGGIFGALWEIAEAGGVGLEADLRAIPVRQETVEICEFFSVNPYQIMSSGSMLMVTDNGHAVTEQLKQAGIAGTVIGKTTGEKGRILHNNGEIRYLDRPQPDELYRALRQ